MESVTNDKKEVNKNEVIRNPDFVYILAENITEIDLSNKDISSVSKLITFPQNLEILNLSWNDLTELSIAITKLTKLKKLDLSHNKITYFNGCPDFCEIIEHLNLAHNHLQEPPRWIWSRDIKNLTYIDLSNNPHMLSNASVDYAQLINHDCRAKYVTMLNCRIDKQIDILKFFPCANELILGSSDYNISANIIEEVPCAGLSECLEINRLILCNIRIFNVNSTIDIYKNLIEIDLSSNNIRSVPKEFCCLDKLEICVLSSNYILFIPDEFVQLKNLVMLYISDNELCMIPEHLFEMPRLKSLDLYNNKLSSVPEDYSKLVEIDLAQNYFEEPESPEYIERKMKLRSNNRHKQCKTRENGIKSDETCENHEEERSNSSFTSDYSECPEEKKTNSVNVNGLHHSSTDEDWDSDAYWDPVTMHRPYVPTPPRTRWNEFVQQKIREGNLYPADMHAVPIMELVRLKRLQDPKVYHESDGQFDDLSGDET